VKTFLTLLAAFCIVSCNRKEQPKHITATIVKNDFFKGEAIADPEDSHIEKALQLLFKDAPIECNIADSIAGIIKVNKVFKAETDKISMIVNGGILKDSIEVTIQRDLSISKKSDFLVTSPNNTKYTFVTNTLDGCSIRPDKIPLSRTATTIHYPLNSVYTLDTISGNFYDDEHNLLENFKGYKTRIYPAIYKVSYTVYSGKKPKQTKKLTYNTMEHFVPYNQLVPNCKRTTL